jgi:uncharacterized protein (DUF433 family)
MLDADHHVPPDAVPPVWVDPERLSGEPCFNGTRVPVKTLFEYLEAGQTIDEFLEDYQGVTRRLAVAVLELARRNLLPPGKAA